MFSRLRLATKLILSILPLLALAVAMVAFFLTKGQKEDIRNQALKSTQTYADLVRESMVQMMITQEMIDDDFLARMRRVRDIRNLNIHFALDSLHLRARFLDTARLVRLRQREDLSRISSADELEVMRTGISHVDFHGNLLRTIIPFKAEKKCQQCHNVREGYVLGAAEMTVSLSDLMGTERTNAFFTIWILYAFATAVLIVGVTFHIIVSKRMKVLLEAARVIGTGDLSHAVEADRSGDELGELASSFDRMRLQLKSAQERLIHSERLSAIGQMASSIIHDFRTPMSTINLSIDSLQRGKEITPEKTTALYRIIRDALRRMVTMAQELLDFSRGDVRLARIDFSVPEFMGLLVHGIEHQLEQANVKLIVEEKFKGNVSFDPDRLHRALVNIINNAQDAMPQGGTLRIATSSDNGTLCFSIADTGVGIPAEIKDKIFDAFVTAGKTKGTGLGLAITKRIIDQHDGTIEVDTERGKGSTFRVKIPLGSGTSGIH